MNAICKLCLQNDADQKNAHLLTDSIIRTSISMGDENSKIRDKEVIFGFSTNVKTFFGRSLLSEEIQKVMGRDLYDEEIEENIHPFTRDNIFCRKCEHRFKVLEDYFYLEVFEKLTKKPIQAEYEVLTLEKSNNLFIRLFFYIQFWRLSAGKFTGWNFRKKEESRLQNLLNTTLGEDLKETKMLSESNREQITSYPFVLTFMKTEKGHPTKNANFIWPRSRNPYYLSMNNFLSVLYFFESQISRMDPTFLWINIPLNSDSLNINEKKLTLTILGESFRKKWTNRFSQERAKHFTEMLEKRFIYIFLHFFNEPPNIKLIQKPKSNLIKCDLPQGIKYSPSHVYGEIESVIKFEARRRGLI